MSRSVLAQAHRVIVGGVAEVKLPYDMDSDFCAGLTRESSEGNLSIPSGGKFGRGTEGHV